MKITKKIRLIILLAILFVALGIGKVLAVSISVSPSKSSVSPGQSFNVTISGNDATGRVNISVSGGSASQSSLWIENNSQTITVTAGSSGTVRISVSGELSSNSGEDKNVSASASVSIVTPSQDKPSSGSGSSSSGSSSSNTKPSNSGSSSSSNKSATQTKQEEEKKSDVSTLSSIIIDGQTISPEFNKDVKEYIASIAYDVTSVNVNAIPTDSKANVAIEGNEGLKEGENTVTITVTAEDGSTSKYLIKIYKGREPLVLKSLIVKYTDKEGKEIELPLNPAFSITNKDYKLGDLEYFVDKLEIIAEANLSDAEIEITGAEGLKEGENIVTITLKVKEPQQNAQEGEEQKEEVITYTIKVNKAAKPSFIDRIKDKIKGIFGGISTWYNNHQKPIVVYSLCACLVFLLALSVYIVVDYKKYKILIDMLAKLEQVNSAKPVKVVQSQEHGNEEDNSKEEVKTKGGKHF